MNFLRSMRMTVNTKKTKVMTIKSQKTTYSNLMYCSNNEEVKVYKYIRINIYDKLNKNYNIEKRINEGLKVFHGLENGCK